MSAERFHEIMATFTMEQNVALRVSIMAERRLRVSFPRDAARDGPAMAAAYSWALAEIERP